MGKLIVIDGSDGSGKATQTQLLATALQELGARVGTMSFPRYDTVTGRTIKQAQADDAWSSIDPYAAALFYVADRRNAQQELQALVAEHDIVILDRYVTSNAIHQGGKIAEPEKRRTFLDWLTQLEYTRLGLPRPDVTVFLDVPPQRSKQLTMTRGGADAVEQDDMYRQRSYDAAQYLAQENDDWHVINCMDGDVLRSREAIHADIVAALKKAI